MPDIRNRKDRNKNGGASYIAILAEVNALDQIRAKVRPRKISLIRISFIKKGYPKGSLKFSYLEKN